MASGATVHPSQAAAGAASRPWLLAVDTSTSQAGIALFDGEQLASLHWPGGRTQTTSVLPAVEDVLRQAGLTIDAVGAVAVATGPGSFTGLRVGLSVAKGLALTGERAVIGVPTLDILAASWAAPGRRAVVAIPAGRGRIVWSSLDSGQNLTPPRNTTFDEFVAEITTMDAALIIGELAPGWPERLAASRIEVAPAFSGLQRAGVLATLGYHRWRRGDVDDAASIEPLYLHGRPNPR